MEAWLNDFEYLWNPSTDGSLQLTFSNVRIQDMVDFQRSTFWVALFSFAFAPTFWNTVARLEYKTHILTKIFFGSKYIGCYVLAATIFMLQLQRDFALVIKNQIIFIYFTFLRSNSSDLTMQSMINLILLKLHLQLINYFVVSYF